MAINVTEETTVLICAVGISWTTITISGAIEIGVSRHLIVGIRANGVARLSANFAESRTEESFEEGKVSKRSCLWCFEWACRICLCVV